MCEAHALLALAVWQPRLDLRSVSPVVPRWRNGEADRKNPLWASEPHADIQRCFIRSSRQRVQGGAGGR